MTRLPCDTLLTADWILTQDKARPILENGAVAVRSGRIAALGPAAQIAASWTASANLHLQDAMLMPALVNAHAHSAMTFLRGLADDQPLMRWLTDTVFPVEARLRPEITRLGAMLGQAEMLASGCVSCIDMYIFEHAVLEAAEMTGMRCMGGEAVFDFPSAACPTPDHALELTRHLAEKYADHPRIKIAVNPHSVYTASGETLRKCAALAKELDLPLHIHLAETEAETTRCLEACGMRPVERALGLGLFEQPAIAAHLVDITEAEARRMAVCEVTGVHNPSSNMKLASGAAPIEMCMAAGMNMALGSDGPASNNQLNMFQEMRQAALLAKLAAHDPACLPAQTALDMATIGGARAFGISGLGMLKEGAPADIIALDLRKPNMQPMHNPVSQAVYAANGSECRLTMAAGEILYLDGRFERFSYDDLLREMESLTAFARRQM